MRDSSPGVASETRRRPTELGSRSGGAGSAKGVAAVRVAVARSYSHVQLAPGPVWVPVSPLGVTTSTRLSVGPRHQTRIVVRSLKRFATEVS